MKAAIFSILTLILAGIVVGDYYLIKLDKDVNWFRDSYIRENYAAEKELYNELNGIMTRVRNVTTAVYDIRDLMY